MLPFFLEWINSRAFFVDAESVKHAALRTCSESCSVCLNWTDQKWSEQVANLFRGAIPERNTNPTDVISKASWLDKLDSLLELNVSKLGEKFETLKNGLIKCSDYIFNFLEDPMIPSDNNASERGIRKLKIKLKNSCTFRSDFGADAFLELHSVVETAKKHNQTPFNAIQALFEV